MNFLRLVLNGEALTDGANEFGVFAHVPGSPGLGQLIESERGVMQVRVQSWRAAARYVWCLSWESKPLPPTQPE